MPPYQQPSTDPQSSLTDSKMEYPLVTVRNACASMSDSDSCEELRVALSGLLPGQPLAFNSDRGTLSQSEAADFQAAARAALSRTHDSEEEDGVVCHYSKPPFAYRHLAAVVRQVAAPEHIVVLLFAIASPELTPTFGIQAAEYNGDDGFLNSPENLVKELKSVVGELSFDRCSLWSTQSEFTIIVLHQALVDLRRCPVALPTVSTPESLLEHLWSVVAHEIHFQQVDLRQVVTAAHSHVLGNKQSAFAATCLARTVLAAKVAAVEECLPCSAWWPNDNFVTAGTRRQCKVCYKEFVLLLSSSNGVDVSVWKQHADAAATHTTLVDASLRKLIDDRCREAEAAAVQYCPMHPELPLTIANASDRGGSCGSCHLTWCLDCPYIHHPHARDCEAVKTAAAKWSSHSEIFRNSACVVVGMFEGEQRKAADCHATRRSTLAEHRLKQVQLQRRVEDLTLSIQKTVASNETELSWSGDQGVLRVIGSRRCPHCHCQPVRRTERTRGRQVICGDQRCRKAFDYNDERNLFQPVSVTEITQERDAAQQTLNKLIAALTALPFVEPVLPEHWPTLACSHCRGKLSGDFHIECYHCTPQYYLCIRCLKRSQHIEHNHHTRHYFALRKPVAEVSQ